MIGHLPEMEFKIQNSKQVSFPHREIITEDTNTHPLHRTATKMKKKIQLKRQNFISYVFLKLETYFVDRCVHACVYEHFAISPPPPPPPPSIDVGLRRLGMPPLNIEKLHTPMVYIGHVQNSAILCCNAWTT